MPKPSYVMPPPPQLTCAEVFQVLSRHDEEAAAAYASMHGGTPSPNYQRRSHTITEKDLPKFRHYRFMRTEREDFELFKKRKSSNLKQRLTECGNRCFYCKCGFKAGRDRERWRTWDHMTPISRGGSNELSNLVPCCFTCNNKKRWRTAEEFLAVI